MSLEKQLRRWRFLFRFLTPHRRLAFWGGGLLVILFFYLLFSRTGSNTGTASPKFASVRRDTLFQTLTLSGSVHSRKAIDLLAPMEWRYDLQIVSLVPEGTQVQPGDTLLKFNTSKLQAELETARRNLQTQKANWRQLLLNQEIQNRQLQNNLTLARLNLEDARLTVQKAKFESDVVQKQAQIALKQAEIQLRRAQQALQNTKVVQQAERVKAEMAVKNAQTDVAALKARIARFSLVSPHSGMVVYGESWFGNGFRKIRLGDKVHAGDALIELPDLKAMESRVFINEVDVHKIRPGQKALLWLEARPGHTYHGVVQKVAEISEPQNFAQGHWWENPSSVHVFRGAVAISDPDSSLKPGMTIKTRVFLDTIPNALLIPETALSEKDGTPLVFTPKGERRVQIGQRNNGSVVVLKGLTEKDRVQLPLPSGAVSFGRQAFYAGHLFANDSLETALRHARFDTTSAKANATDSSKMRSKHIKKFSKIKLRGGAISPSALLPIKKGKK